MVKANDLWACIFRDQVEGKPGPCSVELNSDTAFLAFDKPRKQVEKPKPELVVQLLRSDIELTPALRNVVADMLDSNANSAFCFKKFGRRKRGRHPAWGYWHMEAALYVEEHYIDPGSFDSVVTDAVNAQ